ncbi:hypothetical protein USB125703_00457 [Pseudoclavibacter triregionum]|nr:hypothetical protein USB125703_00457 [Pseudoclavibacter triregionum]
MHPTPTGPDDLPAVELVSETLRKLALQLNEHLVRLSGGWGMVCCQVWAHPVRAYYLVRVS